MGILDCLNYDLSLAGGFAASVESETGPETRTGTAALVAVEAEGTCAFIQDKLLLAADVNASLFNGSDESSPYLGRHEINRHGITDTALSIKFFDILTLGAGWRASDVGVEQFLNGRSLQLAGGELEIETMPVAVADAAAVFPGTDKIEKQVFAALEIANIVKLAAAYVFASSEDHAGGFVLESREQGAILVQQPKKVDSEGFLTGTLMADLDAVDLLPAQVAINASVATYGEAEVFDRAWTVDLQAVTDLDLFFPGLRIAAGAGMDSAGTWAVRGTLMYQLLFGGLGILDIALFSGINPSASEDGNAYAASLNWTGTGDLLENPVLSFVGIDYLPTVGLTAQSADGDLAIFVSLALSQLSQD